MGVIGISNACSTSIVIARGGLGSGRRKFGCCMASAVPVEQLDGSQNPVTGDSFIRFHLRKLSPYQSILPFEVIIFGNIAFFFRVLHVIPCKKFELFDD